MIAGVQVEIRTGHFSNTSLERFSNDSPFRLNFPVYPSATMIHEEKTTLGRPKFRCGRHSNGYEGERCELHLFVSGQGPVAVSFEHGNEPLRRIKRRGGGAWNSLVSSTTTIY